jgi:hypothetical protein
MFISKCKREFSRLPKTQVKNFGQRTAGNIALANMAAYEYILSCLFASQLRLWNLNNARQWNKQWAFVSLIRIGSRLDEQ